MRRVGDKEWRNLWCTHTLDPSTRQARLPRARQKSRAGLSHTKTLPRRLRQMQKGKGAAACFCWGGGMALAGNRVLRTLTLSFIQHEHSLHLRQRQRQRTKCIHTSLPPDGPCVHHPRKKPLLRCLLPSPAKHSSSVAVHARHWQSQGSLPTCLAELSGRKAGPSCHPGRAGGRARILCRCGRPSLPSNITRDCPPSLQCDARGGRGGARARGGGGLGRHQ